MTDVAQESFGSGELSPRVRGLRSSEQYRTGLRQCQNFIVRGYGSLQRRGGTEYISAVHDSTESVRLIPFAIPGVGDYVIEAQDEVFRFYKDGALLGAPYTLTTEYDHLDLSTLQYASDGKDLYFAHKDYWPRKLTRTSDTSWAIAELSFGADFPVLEIKTQPYALSSSNTAALLPTYIDASSDAFAKSDANAGKLVSLHGGWVLLTGFVAAGKMIGVNFVLPPTSSDPTTQWTGIWEPASATGVNITPAAAADAGDVVSLSASGSVFTGTEGKVMDIDSGGTANLKYVQIISVSSGTAATGLVLNGSVTNTTYTDSQILTPTNPLGGITISPDGDTGSIELTASAAYFSANHAPTSTEPGAKFRLAGGYCTVTAFTDTTHVDATVNKDLQSLTATPLWEESWSADSGFPRSLVFHQGRLYFAGATKAHNILWASNPNKPEVFQRTDGEALDTDALHHELKQVGDLIEWLASQENLLIGSRDVESVAEGLITPGEFDFKRQTNFGSAGVQPATADNVAMFAGRSAREVRAFSYNFDDDRYRAQALSDLADHLFASSTILELHYARTPAPALYCLLADGTLLILFYNPQSGVTGWGTWAPGGTDAVVKSLCVVPGTNRDDIYLAVSRTINSGTVVHVERYEPDSRTDSFLDEDTLTLGQTSISGLSHLEGQTVSAKLDGVYRGSFTVSSGAIDISSLNLTGAPTTAEVGLSYSASAKVYPQSFADQGGVRHSKVTSIKGLDLYLVESTGGYVNGSAIKYRTTDDTVGSAASAFTGWKRFDGVNQTDRQDDPVIAITEDRPLDLEIAGLVMSVS